MPHTIHMIILIQIQISISKIKYNIIEIEQSKKYFECFSSKNSQTQSWSCKRTLFVQNFLFSCKLSTFVKNLISTHCCFQNFEPNNFIIFWLDRWWWHCVNVETSSTTLFKLLKCIVMVLRSILSQFFHS